MVFVIGALARPVVSSCRDHQFQPVPLTGWNEVMFHPRHVPWCDRWRVAHVRATATKVDAFGGTFDSLFPVKPRYTFTRQSDGTQEELDGLLPISMGATGTAWSRNSPFDFCSPGDGFDPGVNDNGGNPCCEETCHGEDGNPAACDPDAGHCHCAVPPKCRVFCPPDPAPIIDPGREEADRDVADPTPTPGSAPTTNPAPVAPSVGVDLGTASRSGDR